MYKRKVLIGTEQPYDEFYHVNGMEECFLTGEFTKSLGLSILFLDSIQLAYHDFDNCTQTTNDTIVILRTPIVFSQPVLKSFSSSCQVHICVEWQPRHQVNDNNLIERAFAVGLQSWYEIATIEKIQNHNDFTGRHLPNSSGSNGIKHLESILRIYCIMENTDNSPPRRGMTMHILLLFIQFCVAMKEKNLAIDISWEILELSKDDKTDPNQKSKDGICNIVHYLFTYLILQSHLRSDLLNKFRQNDSAIRTEIMNKTRMESTVVGAIELSLHFCQTKYCDYPDWLHETFRHSQEVLRTKLEKARFEERFAHSGVNSKKSNNIESTLITTRSSDQLNSFVSIITQLISELKIIYKRIKELLMSRLEDRHGVGTSRKYLGIVMIILLISWRRNRRILSNVINKLSATMKLKLLQLFQKQKQF